MRPVRQPGIFVASIAWILLSAILVVAQSTSQEFPTPVTTTEISGTIKPRDLGDARLTSYYYQFDGSQGDLFVNVVTRNFTGDIDIFTQSGLRPLTKIVVYADLSTESETGRVIYLRKPEKMILRVQGRTPGDDPASFRIKFAGSFVASSLTEPAGEPSLPSLAAKNDSGIRVNSVGTIVAVTPRPTPTPTVTEEAAAAVEQPRPEPPTDAKTEDKKAEDAASKVGVVVTDNVEEKPAAAPPTTSRSTTRNRRRGPPKTTQTEPANEAATPPASTTPATSRTRRGRNQSAATTEPKQPDPLEKVNLVILFKDGNTISRPMSEVLRFSVDKGILTVIAKDGSIGRYSILDVSKVTIE